MQEKEHLGGCAYERLFSFKLEVEVLGDGTEAHGKGVDRMAKEKRASGISDFRFLFEAGL